MRHLQYVNMVKSECVTTPPPPPPPPPPPTTTTTTTTTTFKLIDRDSRGETLLYSTVHYLYINVFTSLTKVCHLLSQSDPVPSGDLNHCGWADKDFHICCALPCISVASKKQVISVFILKVLFPRQKIVSYMESVDHLVHCNRNL